MSSNVGDVNSTERGSGARYIDGKPDFSLIPLWTLEEEVRAWMYGRQKYAPWNWTKGMAWSVPFACLMRHLAAWQRGEDVDAESSQTHLALAACNLRMLILFSRTYREGDDRMKDFAALSAPAKPAVESPREGKMLITYPDWEC